jgi:hypothetical protein
MKNQISFAPPIDLDQKILLIAKKKMAKDKVAKPWIVLTSAIAACLIIFLTSNTYINQQKKMSSIVMTEAPEMILNFDQIELMADSSGLSESEWQKVEGSK